MSRKGSSASDILSPRLKPDSGQVRTDSRKSADKQGQVRKPGSVRGGAAQAERDWQTDQTAALPQHKKHKDRSTTAHRLRDYRWAFPYTIRLRIVAAHQEVHDLLHVRVRSADGRRHQVASMSGLAAEIRNIRAAADAGTKADVRAALIAVATSAILLAEQADRPRDIEEQYRVWGGKKKEEPSQRWPPLDLSADQAA